MVDLTQYPDPKPRIWRTILDRFHGEGRPIGLILTGLIVWLVLSQLCAAMYPDTGGSGQSALRPYLNYAMKNGSVFMFFAALIYIVRITRKTGDMPLAQYVAKHKDPIKQAVLDIPLRLIIALLSFGLFMFAYSTIKTRIPEIMPYQWDEAFYKLDKLFFLGRDPWQYFAWLYEFPSVIRAMDFIYDVWAVVLVGTWTLCFMFKSVSPDVRYRFPLALMLTWFVGGNLLATLLSSVGPCYYGLITGVANDPYAAQMAQLQSLHAIEELRAVAYQDILWGIYESPSVGLGGISAMPSMHCATSFLLVLLAWNKPKLRYAALAFFSFIFIASFVLAWHYAVDGLFAIPIALGAWTVAKWLLKPRKA